MLFCFLMNVSAFRLSQIQKLAGGGAGAGEWVDSTERENAGTAEGKDLRDQAQGAVMREQGKGSQDSIPLRGSSARNPGQGPGSTLVKDTMIPTIRQ